MTTLRVPEEHAGKQARCPNCKHVLAVPEASTGREYSAGAQPSQPTKSVESAPSINPYAGTMQSPTHPRRNYLPHRGNTVLVMGIFALVCNFMAIPGIIAWVMGSGDLKQINAGAMDPEGKGLTQAGMIMGIIGTALAIIPLLFMIAYLVFIVIAIAAGVAGAGM